MSSNVEKELKRLDRRIGELDEEDRRLRERIAASSGSSTGLPISAVVTGGVIVAGAGLTGGGSLPGTVTLNVGTGDGIDVLGNSIAVDIVVGGGLKFTATELEPDEANIDHDALNNFESNEHVALPATIAAVLTDHDKAAHDALNIDADTLDALDSTVFLSPEYLVLTADGDLAAERVLTPGDGLDENDAGAGNAYTLSVDVTDIIDTTKGLTETANDIQINNGFGLAFSTGALVVDQGMVPTWTGEHTFESDIQLDANLDFVGAQSITTTAGDLAIAPAGNLILDPVGDDVLPNINYDINLGSLIKKYLSIHAAELWVSTLVAQDTIATIGGRILVGPTTTLTVDLSSATVNGASELSNGGFETAGGGGADIFANWIETAGDGSIAQDSTIYHWDSNSCKLVSGDSSNTEVYQDASVVAGEDKEYLFWTRGDGTLAGRYRVYDVDNATDILATTTTGITAATWTRVIYRYEVPVGCSTVRVFYYCPTRSSNGINNSGFETAGAGGADVFANWAENAADGGILRDSATKQAGTYSCKLTAGAAANTYVFQNDAGGAGKSRELRFYTRGDGTYQGQYSVWDLTNGANIISKTGTGVTGTSWTEVVDNYTVPAGCTTVRIYFWCPDTDTGIAWFDEVDHFSGHAHFDDVDHHDQVTIEVKHDEMTTGDVAYMEASGKVEFYDITSAPSGAGPYTYYVWRDRDGTGTNDWYAGDALFNTGNVNDGFIDIYSVHGIKAPSEYGPTLVANVRNSAVYNDWTPVAAIGELNGVYGYSSSAYGLGLGQYSASDYLTIDTANGIRFLDLNDVVQGQLSSSVWTLGEVDVGKSNVQITAGAVRLRTNAVTKILLESDGDVFIGEDISAAATTNLAIFTNDQTYNTESVYVGDMLFGDNSSGKANLYWDKSAGEVLFRNGQVKAMALSGGDLDFYDPLANKVAEIYGNAIAGGVTTNAQGISVIGSHASSNRAVELLAGVGGFYCGISADAGSVDQVQIFINNSAKITVSSSITITPDILASADIRVGGGLYVGQNADPDPDDIHFDGNLKSMKNSATYDVYSYHVLTSPLTSGSWTDTSKTTSEYIDLGTDFSLPANVKAVYIRGSFTDETQGVFVGFGYDSGSQAVGSRVQVANTHSDFAGICPIYGADSIYFYLSGEIDSIYLQIHGYFI